MKYNKYRSKKIKCFQNTYKRRIGKASKNHPEVTEPPELCIPATQTQTVTETLSLTCVSASNHAKCV
jgi:hypothetical protein